MWKYCWIKYTTYNIYNKWETNTENSIEKFDKIETKKENKGHRRSFWAKVKKDIELVESFKHEEKFQIFFTSQHFALHFLKATVKTSFLVCAYTSQKKIQSNFSNNTQLIWINQTHHIEQEQHPQHTKGWLISSFSAYHSHPSTPHAAFILPQKVKPAKRKTKERKNIQLISCTNIRTDSKFGCVSGKWKKAKAKKEKTLMHITRNWKEQSERKTERVRNPEHK